MYKALKIRFSNERDISVIENIFVHKIVLNFYNIRIIVLSDSKHVINRLKNFYFYFHEEMTSLELNITQYNTVLIYTGKNKAIFAYISRILNLPPKLALVSVFFFDNLAYYFRDVEIQYYFSGVYIRNFIIKSLFNNFIFIHGAAMSLNKKTFILPGAAAVGKTSISFLLLKEGYKLISDDIIMLERKSLKIYPFPVLMNFREYSINNIKQLFFLKSKKPDVLLLNEKRWFYYPDKNEQENRILSLDTVFIVQRSDENCIRKCEKTTFITEMFPHFWFPIDNKIYQNSINNNLDILIYITQNKNIYSINSNNIQLFVKYINSVMTNI